MSRAYNGLQRVSRRLAVAAVLMIVFSLAPLAGRSFAGQAGTATVTGQVTDESRAVLPGVTVTATSPALQVPSVTTVTDSRGEYRLTPLPIGTYTLLYELAGFQTVRREGIGLTNRFTAQVDMALKLGGLQETLTVSGAAPIVDMASTGAATVLTKDTIDLLPSSRASFEGVLSQTPAARPPLDVGGSTFNSATTFYAMGQRSESWHGIENIIMTAPGSQQAGNYLDFATYEESTVQIIGHPAEVPSRGIFMNSIVKSGSNDFHGTVFFAHTSDKFQGSNISEALKAQGITGGDDLVLRDDSSADVGGRILRDKLWFYIAGRMRRQDDRILACFTPEGDRCVNTERSYFITPKVTYQLNAATRIIGFAQPHFRRAIRGGSRLQSWDARADRRGNEGVWKVEGQTVIGPSVVMSILAGGWYVRSGTYDSGQATRPSARDRVTGDIWGADPESGQRNTQDRRQLRGNASWYKPNWAGGNHQFKGGFDLHWNRAERTGVGRSSAIGNYRLNFRSGVADEIDVFSQPVFPVAPIRLKHFYVQDSWAIARRLTLNLGVRYGHDSAEIPDQCRETADAPGHLAFPARCYDEIDVPTFGSFAPRLHASYDLTGDGRTIVKSGWSRYYQIRNADDLQIGNRNNLSTARYRWRDLNGNRDYDAGEVNLDPNGPDFIDASLLGITGAVANGVINPDATQRYQDEIMVSLERHVKSNWAVRATGVHSTSKDEWRLANPLRPYGLYNIAVTNRDPGPDGIAGNGDDPGTSITYYDYPAAVAGLRFQQPMVVNDPAAGSTYQTLEASISRRLANDWQFRTSYSATKKNIPFVPNAGGVRTGFYSTQDPNSEINLSDISWEWIFRAGGSYRFPHDILASANFDHRSGEPYARTVLLRGGRQISSIVLNAEPIGTRRLDNTNLLSLRGEKRFSVGAGKHLTARLNLYNAINSAAVLSVIAQSGPNFGLATSIVRPRILEWSVSYSF